jgi:hypothetical protein
MVSILKPLIDKTIQDKARLIIDNQIIPWAFFYTSRGVSVRRYDGKLISYAGIKFFGTPVEVFWNGYIEPYIEKLVVESIEAVSKQIKENNLDSKKEFDYLSVRLGISVERIYREMQRVDQTLKNTSLSHTQEKRSPVNIDNKVIHMKHFIDQHINMALQKQKSILLEFAYNPYVVLILSGIILAAILMWLNIT